MPWPRLDAEGLRVVRDVPEARQESPGSIPALWQPARHDGPPPAWLLPHQHEAWRRAVAALQVHGAAMVAEPVGAGKTWIALAVAAALGATVTVVAPRIVLPQWRLAAARVLPRLRCHALEGCSRGVPPPDAGTLAIVDEAHRLRHPGTRRVATLAPWLARRRVLLLTATPVVNRRDDLVAVLRLALPDHALALDGLPSLAALAREDIPPPAIRRLVIRTGAHGQVVAVARHPWPHAPPEMRRARRAARCIRGLRLASSGSIRRLLLGVLADAAASSDAAWHAALRRYRGLLVHAREAGGVSRAMLRRLAGPEGEQGVLWSLLEPGRQHEPPRLPLEDIEPVERALALPRRDTDWMELLRDRCGDDRITIVFCRHRATARAVRCHLGDATAWVTGATAGIGPHHLPRADVLSAFGPLRPGWQVRRTPPRILVATDVAAEGLDLQAAERVVHLDLPWTAMRRDQRDGRVRRVGQLAARIDVIERHPAPPLEALLHLALRVRRKDMMARRWLTAITAPLDAVAGAPLPPPPTQAIVVALQAGVLRGQVVVAVTPEGAAVLPPACAAALVATAERCDPVDDADTMRRARIAALAVAEPPPPHRALLARIHRLARVAARRREGATLEALDRLLRHVIRGGPIGLEHELDAIARRPDRDLPAHSLPAVPPPDTPTATVVGVLVPRPGPRLR